MLPSYYLFLYEWLQNIGLPAGMLRLCVTVSLWFIVFLADFILFWIFTHPIGNLIKRIADKTKTLWDDFIITDRVIHALGVFIFALLLSRYLPLCTLYYPEKIAIIVKWLRIVNILSAAVFGNALVKSVHDAAMRLNPEMHGLAAYRNMAQTAIWVISSLIIISILLNRDVAYVVSGIGAMAAVLLLVFKDSILGMVAGMKLSFNKMLKTGDWICVPSCGANGIVRDVRLSTIKVENWDNSIVSVPPYALISGGFQNMQFMKEKGGRRIMRSINIDASGVRFLHPDEMGCFHDEEWAKGIDLDRPQVNLTLFRNFLRHYISNVPTVREDMLHMIRELQPTAEGIPIEVYMFTSRTDWKDFEEVQADIMDNIFASLPRFSLSMFQHPSGNDFRMFASPKAIVKLPIDQPHDI